MITYRLAIDYSLISLMSSISYAYGYGYGFREFGSSQSLYDTAIA